MWVLLTRESVETILEHKRARAQAARRDDGMNKGIILSFGDSHET